MVERNVNKALYKIELLLIKIIPFIIMLFYILNSILSYFNIDILLLSVMSGLSILTWLFLFISSFVFRFCVYHRLPLYYVLIADIINYYDNIIGIPISNKSLFTLNLIIAGVFILLIVYFKFKQHESRTSK
jgi:hypothetical protein